MSEADSRDSDAELRDDVQDMLREDGLDELAEFINGPVRINELDIGDFMAALDEDYIVRLRNDSEEIQYAKATNDDLIQVIDGGRGGEFSRPTKLYRGEAEDYIFSGEYQVRLTFPEMSAFEVAEA